MGRLRISDIIALRHIYIYFEIHHSNDAHQQLQIVAANLTVANFLRLWIRNVHGGAQVASSQKNINFSRRQ